MKLNIDMNIIKHPEIGICGLSCRLCPRYHTETDSKCDGCKSQSRMVVGCPFITCALKKKGVEFCWDCDENTTCSKWKSHREFGKKHDTFICYQKLEENIYFITSRGVIEYEKEQKIRENILKDMLKDFNEGRSRSYYSITVTVLSIKELKEAMAKAYLCSKETDIKARAKILHSLIDEIAKPKNYCLHLRK